MLTIFSTPKPFKGHIGTIQRNAIHSWTLLVPRPEIILFGDDEGTAEAAQDFDVAYVSDVARNEFGTPLINDFFEKAERIATNSTLCYVNADIILTSEFMNAVERVSQRFPQFLMVGQRWDVDIREALDFSSVHWEGQVKALAISCGQQRPPQAIDYFVFPKRQLNGIPPFAIGRPGWDNWLIWKARSLKIPVVDATRVAMIVHQNHDYSHHPRGASGVLQGKEARSNRELIGKWTHIRSIEDATHRLSQQRISRNCGCYFIMMRRAVSRTFSPVWFKILDVSRPLRHRLGLRRRQGAQSATRTW
jgi:hypothetical protein